MHGAAPTAERCPKVPESEQKYFLRFAWQKHGTFCVLRENFRTHEKIRLTRLIKRTTNFVITDLCARRLLKAAGFFVPKIARDS
jgi:hypothetical protein